MSAEEKEKDFEIDVVDDTPEKDKGKPASIDVKEPDDSELENYSENVQKRFKQLTAKIHTERRAKEAFERENREAFSFAQKVASENKQLQSLIVESQKTMAETAKKGAASKLEQAKSSYREAYEAGNSDKIVEAQESMARAVNEQERWDKFRPIEEREIEQHQPRRAEVPKLDKKAEKWASENEWFGADKEMTGTAYGVHERLVRDEGVDPESDDYYNRIDKEMRKRYPEKFEDVELEKPERQTQKVSAVAPVSRSVKQPRRMTLTTTQVALAKRLGITSEQYAAQVAKDMQNG
ncbi:MAG: hypothetical protein JW384_04288 [Nitrosomonadaceae bacterium]|nr:hypothetical protein [Nitrosomonadaceae bacterium]